MKLNRKGFTLIEVISTVVILGVIVVIVFPNFIGYFDTAEEKSEELFIKETSRIIDAYVSLEGRKLSFNNTPFDTITKCEYEDDPDTCKEVNVFESTNLIKFQNIIDSGLIGKNELINPNGKISCNVNTLIEVFRDEDYVYCYRTNLDCVDVYFEGALKRYDIDTCGFVE